VGPQIPVIYSVPYIRNIEGYSDRRLEKHCRYILHELIPDTFEQPKKSFFKRLFSRKEEMNRQWRSKA